MACASFLFLTIIKRMPSFLEHPFYNMENTFWNDNPYPMLFYYWARIGVMTIPSAPIPVFLFTISSIWARWASVNSAALIITSTVSSVMLTMESLNPFVVSNIYSAVYLSAIYVIVTMLLIAVVFCSSVISQRKD